MDTSDEDRAIREVIERLIQRFPQLPAEDVEQAVQQVRPEFEQSPIRDFIPLFVERNAVRILLQRPDSPPAT
jgi:hypothetical protein